MKTNKCAMVAVCVICLLLSSCQKWLTVSPKAEATDAMQFSSERGFQDALTGVYIQLKSPALYGKALSYGAMEHLMNSWDVSGGTVEQYLGLFYYNDPGVQAVFRSVFEGEYTAIANLNEILANIESRKTVFTTKGMYETIKSECLALRAFCHFDILRLFGPVPLNTNNTNILPYVTVLSKQPQSHIGFEQYKLQLLQDLTEAEALVKDIDPFLQYTYAEIANPGNASLFQPASSYLAYRFIRMNYYAIKGLQARAYLWFGEQQKAYESASTVINARNRDGSPKFPLGNAASFTAGDMNLITEQLFGLYDQDLRTKYKTDFVTGKLKKGATDAIVTIQLYGNTKTDIRETSLWTQITTAANMQAYILKKYGSAVLPLTATFGQSMIPMLRASEMYLIAIEAAPGTNEAQKKWDQFRSARNLSSLQLPPDVQSKQLMLAKEYQREFLGEGQSFYAYKRINAPKSAILWAQAAAILNYVVPLPVSEF